jgi:hypothetical protein
MGCLAVAVIAAGIACGAVRPADASNATIDLSDIVPNLLPAVVNISTRQLVVSGSGKPAARARASAPGSSSIPPASS